MKISLIDYGSGNIQSAYKALELASNYKNKILQDTYFYKIEFNKNGKLITQTGKFVLIK